MSIHAGPFTPEINPHVWARNTDDAQPGAVIYIRNKDLFISQADLPAAIARLQAIHDLNA